MDTNTLTGLENAYQVAPSDELAKVICFALVELEKEAEVNNYLLRAKNVLDESECLKLAEGLYRAEQYEVARTILSDKVLSHKILIAKCLIELGESEQAKLLYCSTVEADATFESHELNRLFSVDVKIADLNVNNKPKLKIIEKTEMASVTNLVRYRQDTSDFSDVVGLEHIKKQINKKIILPFQRTSLFQKFKKKIGGGVILYGPPGCGKTLLARATAGECKASFFNIEISDVLDMYIGESEQKLHAIFEKARASTPCVLFFDEIEALAGKREHSRNSSTANVVSQFLTELDGFTQNNEGVLVLASTNVPWAVDAAFLRPGRFDRMFFVPPPDKSARKAILEHHIKGRPAETDIDFSSIAEKAIGYSGADLYNLVEMAADEAIDDSIEQGGEVTISNEHFKAAIKDARSTTTEWLTTARNYARYANEGGRYDEVLDFLKKHGK
jgi:ATP-dependent 26S proteasome regulatory subunit